MSVITLNAGGGGASDYLEYAWVVAPNTAGQSLSNNVETVCTLDTEVADDGGHGSILSNRVTLDAGTYLFKIYVPLINGGSDQTASIISLYNYSDSAYISRKSAGPHNALGATASLEMEGQFTIASSKAFEVKITTMSNSGTNYISCATATTNFTLNTAGAAQRTTLKLWKLA